jgi:replication-associated recombination protein RarA
MKCEVKYAPKTLDEVIYPDEMTKTVIEGYATGGLEGHLLLHGPRGAGKTTIAELIPKQLNGANSEFDKDFDTLLANKDMKGFIQRSICINNISTQKYCLVFNEFDNAKVRLDKLWGIMDDCPNEFMVIITTNHPMEINESIRSRCDVIAMPAVKAISVLPRAKQILSAEAVPFDEDQLFGYLQQVEYRGDLREYMRILDKFIYAHSKGIELVPCGSQKTKLRAV